MNALSNSTALDPHAVAHAAIMAARSGIIRDHLFYGALVIPMPFVAMPGIGTAATDGTSIFYEPGYVLKITPRQRRGLVIHEVEHCARGHHVRMGERDLKEWNICCDYSINRNIIDLGEELPAGALLDRSMDGLSPEEIYAARAEAKRKAQEQAAKDRAANEEPTTEEMAEVYGTGGVMRPGKGTPAEIEAQRIDWSIRVVEATAVARRNASAPGETPGYVQSILNAASAPVIDVREAFAAFIDSKVVTDQSWSRPNRRYIPHGYHFPGNVIDGLEHVVFVIDDSGSMDDHKLALAAAAVVEAREEGKIQRLTVLFADTRVHDRLEFEPGDEIKLETTGGGGGTRFADSFRVIDAEFPDATAVIYLTDLEVSDHDAWIEPACPVLFAVFGDSRDFERYAAQIPFGTARYIGRLE
jgi:predicted metal-dependent peptidase